MYNNKTDKDIVYVDYRTSAAASWGVEDSSKSDSLINVIKNRNVAYIEETKQVKEHKNEKNQDISKLLQKK